MKYSLNVTSCDGEGNCWSQIQQNGSFLDAGNILLLSVVLNSALEVKDSALLEVSFN